MSDKIEAALTPESTAPISSPSPIPEEGRGHISIFICGSSVKRMWRPLQFFGTVAIRAHQGKIVAMTRREWLRRRCRWRSNHVCEGTCCPASSPRILWLSRDIQLT